MCGIAGIINFKKNLFTYEAYNRLLVRDMAQKLSHRGPDASGEWVGEHAAFSHARLSVIDIEGGKQPMKKTIEGYEFVITYNGELYNTKELKNELIKCGYVFTTNSDTEVLLYTYIHYGVDCCKKLNGIYSFCIWDSMRQQIYICRDRFGVKPLFYANFENNIIFASEIKALFCYPNFKPRLDKNGLCEIFALSPAKTQGVGVFKGVDELRPGCYMLINRSGLFTKRYWQFESKEHKDSYEETIENVRDLVCDSIKRQLVSDVPIGTLLSGGLDSSIISAVAATELKKENKQLSTYSFDYEDNDRYFKASAFQPDADKPWVKRMVEEFDTNHTFLVCKNENLINYLYDAMYYKDLPGMADCDSSLLYFCREIKKNHTVILSGECSDEIFGGYPWFRSEKAFKTDAFPWCYDLSLRKKALKPVVEETLNLEEYSKMRYFETINETPVFDGDNEEEKRRREIAYLNITWFMTNLLDRKDRMSMASGLEVRVPFCDHRLFEYVWNIPWEMKNKNNISKNILREAAKTILPYDVLNRKKSPYPKTHNPYYEKAVRELLYEILNDQSSPILTFVDRANIMDICKEGSDYGKPFFGQLMAIPQFMGYLIQVNYWLDEFKPALV
ncbi:MAG: asparagine synthase (glutamine-hydrolyzing) [Clostridia bacterium]|nr:asparagine synthase (glutamine-hydrolyzing) [Clostridia bacterium]